MSLLDNILTRFNALSEIFLLSRPSIEYLKIFLCENTIQHT